MDVVIAPDNRLRVKTKPVKKISPALKNTIKDMVKLAKSFIDPEGVGLASTQIGQDAQYFIAKMDGKTFKSFFNPKIISYSKTKKKFLEGCLSIPDYYGEIERSTSVTVVYQNDHGKQVKEKLTGSKAWFFQHEYDHLQGKLMIDHVLEQKARLYKVSGRDRTGAEIFEEILL